MAIHLIQFFICMNGEQKLKNTIWDWWGGLITVPSIPALIILLRLMEKNDFKSPISRVIIKKNSEFQTPSFQGPDNPKSSH
ncbi:hypothetical protein, partial [Planktothrix sp. FACHB-1355]|uniref:hypothetical protein n=1 Tax=Planktothrix sp. FACHB-1355 TaxID=2692854 RepID=UPI001A7EF11F